MVMIKLAPLGEALFNTATEIIPHFLSIIVIFVLTLIFLSSFYFSSSLSVTSSFLPSFPFLLFFIHLSSVLLIPSVS
jgi:hypothetical protein